VFFTGGGSPNDRNKILGEERSREVMGYHVLREDINNDPFLDETPKCR